MSRLRSRAAGFQLGLCDAWLAPPQEWESGEGALHQGQPHKRGGARPPPPPCPLATRPSARLLLSSRAQSWSAPSGEEEPADARGGGGVSRQDAGEVVRRGERERERGGQGKARQGRGAALCGRLLSGEGKLGERAAGELSRTEAGDAAGRRAKALPRWRRCPSCRQHLSLSLFYFFFPPLPRPSSPAWIPNFSVFRPPDFSLSTRLPVR